MVEGAERLLASRELPPEAAELVGALVAELRRTDLELREADAKYRALVEQIPAIVYVDVADESMSTAYVSPQIRDLLGISPEEYIADPDLWYKHLHPDDKERALAAYLAGRDSGEPFTFEYRLLARDGRVVWFRDSAVVVKDAEGRPAFIHGVMLDITEAKKAEEQLAFLAYHDPLTGLPNRAMFEELLELALARARRHDLAVAVLFLDLDEFKLVNDSLGHEAGDELLRRVAERLREATRETDLVARQGGDEFLLLLADLETGVRTPLPGDADGAMLIAESVAARIQEALREPFRVAGTEVYVTASIGISLFPHHGGDGAALLRLADAAMFQSKRTGPGGYVIHAPTDADALMKLSLTTRLRRAVEERNWELHYQPLVDLADGRMVGVEALLRWPDPNGGLVPPGDFIPLAEEMGLIEAIGDWVVEELCRQDRRWREEGLDLEISFNLSTRELWRPELADRIAARLAASGTPPEKVVVEVTESAAMVDPDRTRQILLGLRERGLRIALDDFGSGYSSLSRLRDLPVQVLKIDRSFVRDCHADLTKASMVRAIVALAEGLGMVPLAEGIESEDEWRFLVGHGCAFGQGYFFSRPVPADELSALARRAGFRLVGGAAS
ncbi:MAG TPA: EAL domain-containing protein [Actinomycetota bacterium]|nr:EAL domain-containing protein [Actinomycetota bacterium]